MKYLHLKAKKTILLLGDLVFLYLSLWLTLNIHFGFLNFGFSEWWRHFIPFSLLYAVWIVVFYIFNLYSLSFTKNTPDFYFAFLKSLVVCGLLGTAFFYLVPFVGVAPKTNLILNLIIFFGLFSAWRYLYNFLITHFFAFQKNILIIGNNSQIDELTQFINSNPQLGYNLVSIIGTADVGLLENLNERVDIVICGSSIKSDSSFFKKGTLFNLQTFLSFFERIIGKIPLSQVDQNWVLTELKEKNRSIYISFKRVCDVLIGIILGIFTLILLPFIALAIKIDSAGPVFYSQKRVGKNGKIFNLYKFRSMRSNAEKGEPVWAKEKDPRITRIGKILRKTLLDEAPQFWNIIKGEMSFVGPRPERPKFVNQLEKEIPFYQARHIVKPGITGWAQVNYPYGNSVEDAFEKLQYELYYIKNLSLALDFRIILKTINLLLRGGTQ